MEKIKLRPAAAKILLDNLSSINSMIENGVVLNTSHLMIVDSIIECFDLFFQSSKMAKNLDRYLVKTYPRVDINDLQKVINGMNEGNSVTEFVEIAIDLSYLTVPEQSSNFDINDMRDLLIDLSSSPLDLVNETLQNESLLLSDLNDKHQAVDSVNMPANQQNSKSDGLIIQRFLTAFERVRQLQEKKDYFNDGHR